MGKRSRVVCAYAVLDGLEAARLAPHVVEDLIAARIATARAACEAGAARKGRVIVEPVVVRKHRPLNRDVTIFQVLAKTEARPSWKKPRKHQ